MPAVNLSPIFNGWQGFTPAGLPLSGGLVQTYLAGTSTPATTYTSSAGTIANTNPIQLQADGRTPSEIWLPVGSSYKFVLLDSLSGTIATYDNITGIVNSPTSIWVSAGATPTFISATQFTVPGNLLTTFPPGIRIQYTIASSQFYGSVTASSFGAGVTTVTVLADSTPLTSGLNAVNVSQLTPNNSPVPATVPLFTTFQAGINVGNADQASASTLDWYLEQTFTPTWGGLTTVGVTTYAQQNGYGTRIGNMFFFQIVLNIVSATGTGSAAINGLPYQPNITNSAAMPIVTNAGTPMAVQTTATVLLTVINSTTGAAIGAGSPSNTTYQINGFFHI